MRFVSLTWFWRMEPATRTVTSQTREVFSRPDAGSGPRLTWEFTHTIFNNHLIQPQKKGDCQAGGVNRLTRQPEALFLCCSTSHFALISMNLGAERNFHSCQRLLYHIGWMSYHLACAMLEQCFSLSRINVGKSKLKTDSLSYVLPVNRWENITVFNFSLWKSWKSFRRHFSSCWWWKTFVMTCRVPSIHSFSLSLHHYLSCKSLVTLFD